MSDREVVDLGDDLDLVDSLRVFASLIEKSDGVAQVTMLSGSLFDEAADEIDKLRGWESTAAELGDRLVDAEDVALRAVWLGDMLVRVLRSGSDCGWDRAIDMWEKFRDDARGRCDFLADM